MVTSMGKRSSLRILNAMQRNKTRIKSATKETKGRLARWMLRSSGLKVRRAQVDFATSRMAEVFGVFKD